MGSVLVLGSDPDLRRAIESTVVGTAVRCVGAVGAPDAQRRDVEVVVVAGDRPLDGVMDVRVRHPLNDKPIVLYAPGRRFDGDSWRALDIWPITSEGEDAYRDVAHRVGWLLSRAHHPASARDASQRQVAS